MTFIDWSNSDEMLGLLGEYIADARSEAQGDQQRLRFLEHLSTELAEVTGYAHEVPVADAIKGLRGIRDSVDSEFANDPVMAHVDACIEELERINQQVV